MLNFLIQVFGLVLLIAGVYIGYLRWIKPHQDSLSVQGRGLLFLIVLTLMGGFVGSPFWWMDEARSFSWDLPPLASRMLAAAGWSFVVVSFLALQRPTFKRVRLVLMLLFVYLTPLALAIILFHLDRFDPTAPIVYAFFAIVVLMVTSTMYYLLKQPTIIPDEIRDEAPSSPLIRYWLATVALICTLWGTALFLTDNGPSRFIWVWVGDLLSSRLIGVMLLAIAVGAITSFRYADVANLMMITLSTYGIGLALASLWNMVAGKPVPVSYLSVFGGMALISVLLLSKNKLIEVGDISE
ncbi:MAG: hypothetical protein GY755_05390 [Chloroflexi bacterium]|nr:hypothetical protein [Chloroflexota bacterium]